MNLYLLSQSDNSGYDTYDSCVVCAKSKKDAITITPDESVFKENEMFATWANKLVNIKCEHIGKASKKQKRGVILASFNAG